MADPAVRICLRAERVPLSPAPLSPAPLSPAAVALETARQAARQILQPSRSSSGATTPTSRPAPLFLPMKTERWHMGLKNKDVDHVTIPKLPDFSPPLCISPIRKSAGSPINIERCPDFCP